MTENCLLITGKQETVKSILPYPVCCGAIMRHGTPFTYERLLDVHGAINIDHAWEQNSLTHIKTRRAWDDDAHVLTFTWLLSRDSKCVRTLITTNLSTLFKDIISSVNDKEKSISCASYSNALFTPHLVTRSTAKHQIDENVVQYYLHPFLLFLLFKDVIAKNPILSKAKVHEDTAAEFQTIDG